MVVGNRNLRALHKRRTSEGADVADGRTALGRCGHPLLWHPSLLDTWKYPRISISIRCRRSCTRGGLCVYQKGAISIRKGRDNPGDSHRPRLTSEGGWLWPPDRFGANQPPSLPPGRGFSRLPIRTLLSHTRKTSRLATRLPVANMLPLATSPACRRAEAQL